MFPKTLLRAPDIRSDDDVGECVVRRMPKQLIYSHSFMDEFKSDGVSDMKLQVFGIAEKITAGAESNTEKAVCFITRPRRISV